MGNALGASRLEGLDARIKAVARRSKRGELDGLGAPSGPVLFRYPAMMVPSVQSAIFDAVLRLFSSKLGLG